MSEHEKALRRIYEAMSRWDIDELVDDVAHDMEWSVPDPLPWGGTFHGHDGVRAFATIFEEHVDGVWADPDEFVHSDEAPDLVVVLGRVRGRAKQGGRDFEVGFAHAWSMSDGVASRLVAYLDSAPILAALRGEDPPG